jgi:hypothetical protein
MPHEAFSALSMNYATNEALVSIGGQRPNAIEHLVIPSTEGHIVWSIASTPIK